MRAHVHVYARVRVCVKDNALAMPSKRNQKDCYFALTWNITPLALTRVLVALTNGFGASSCHSTWPTFSKYELLLYESHSAVHASTSETVPAGCGVLGLSRLGWLGDGVTHLDCSADGASKFWLGDGPSMSVLPGNVTV